MFSVRSSFLTIRYDAEASAGAGAGLYADDHSRASALPVAGTNADREGLAATSDRVWGAKGAAQRLARHYLLGYSRCSSPSREPNFWRSHDSDKAQPTGTIFPLQYR